MTTEGPDLITSTESALLLRLGHRTFNRRVVAGEIVPAITLPGPKGARLFDREYIETLAAERTEGAA